jgi:flagellar protein FlaG
VKLQLDIDRNTGTVIGRVVDKETGELVRQIPSEEMIALMARSAEISALLDKSV